MEVIDTKAKIHKLAHNLNELITLHRITEQELARAVDLPYNSIRRICTQETKDPRASTLQLIANYFRITIDNLLNGDISPNVLNHVVTRYIPIIGWDKVTSISTVTSFHEITTKWLPLAIDEKLKLSDHAFALESRPSIHEKYPPGTSFVIDPELRAIDGDMVLVQLNENDEVTLKIYCNDPPEKKLRSVINKSETINFNCEKDKILGVNRLILTNIR